MKKVKNGVTIGLLGLLIFLCIIGLLYLNEEWENREDTLNLTDAEEMVYSNYSSLLIDYMDLEQYILVEGVITNDVESPLETVSIKGKKENLCIGQGESFLTGEVLYAVGKETYTAPYDGIMDRIQEEGDKLILTLCNYQNRYVEAKVSFEMIEFLTLGQEISFFYGTYEMVGWIDYISSLVEDGCVEIHVLFEDEAFSLLLEAPVTLKIVKEKVTQVIAVPQAVLIQNGGTNYIRVRQSDGSARLVEVTIGLIGTDGWVEVQSGITVEDVILFDASLVTIE